MIDSNLKSSLVLFPPSSPSFFSLHNFDDTNLHKQTNILLLHSRMLSAKRSSLYSPGLSRDRYFHDKENMDEKSDDSRKSNIPLSVLCTQVTQLDIWQLILFLLDPFVPSICLIVVNKNAYRQLR